MQSSVSFGLKIGPIGVSLIFSSCATCWTNWQQLLTNAFFNLVHISHELEFGRPIWLGHHFSTAVKQLLPLCSPASLGFEWHCRLSGILPPPFSFFFCFLCHSFSAFHCSGDSMHNYTAMHYVFYPRSIVLHLTEQRRGQFDGAGSEPIRRNKEWWLSVKCGLMEWIGTRVYCIVSTVGLEPVSAAIALVSTSTSNSSSTR